MRIQICSLTSYDFNESRKLIEPTTVLYSFICFFEEKINHVYLDSSDLYLLKNSRELVKDILWLIMYRDKEIWEDIEYSVSKCGFINLIGMQISKDCFLYVKNLILESET